LLSSGKPETGKAGTDMGMIDTIIFDRPIACPKCVAEMRSDQTKAFDCTLDNTRRYLQSGVGRGIDRIRDCVAHAEEICIVGDVDRLPRLLGGLSRIRRCGTGAAAGSLPSPGSAARQPAARGKGW